MIIIILLTILRLKNVAYYCAALLKVMGPLHMTSAAPSTVGSGSESEWGREYEDEDTWYEFSSAYQTGPETHLFPSKDTGLSVRMAKYRRSDLPSATVGGFEEFERLTPCRGGFVA